MLINTNQKQKFIFIANTKTASTSIENILIEHSHISIKNPPPLKHMGYKKIIKNFNFLFSRPGMSVKTFYKFSVIRDPVDWLVSWFNYRSREQLSNPNHPKHKNYTGNLSFDDFIDLVIYEQNEQKIKPQSNLFLDEQNNNVMDFVIKYENLHEDFNYVCHKIGLDIKLPHKNKSQKQRINKQKIMPITIDKIKKFYVQDYKFIDNLTCQNSRS